MMSRCLLLTWVCALSCVGMPSEVDSGATSDAGGPSDAGEVLDSGVTRDAGPFMPNPTLAALAANTALDLGEYACTQPADNPGGCKAITDYGRFNHDALGHQLLMFGGGHAGAYGNEVEVLAPTKRQATSTLRPRRGKTPMRRSLATCGT